MTRKIEAFAAAHSERARPIGDVVRRWNAQRAATDLADAVIVGGAMAADLLSGDGFRDQIPIELRDAVAALSGAQKNAAAYDTARRAIASVLERGDENVAGWVNKYKGQLGENLFVEQLGAGARLASSGSQAGYDVVRESAQGLEYIQVKLYRDPAQVLDKMVEIQERLESGAIISAETGDVVGAISWAVPHDIVDEVRRLVAETPELGKTVVHSVGITADEAAAVVLQGVDAVGAEGFEATGDFLGELGGGVGSVVGVQAAIVGFLWWKGERDAEEARAQIANSAVTSSAAFGVALAAEEIADSLLLGGPVGFALGLTARQVVGRALSSRQEFVRHNGAANSHLEALVEQMASWGGEQHSPSI